MLGPLKLSTKSLNLSFDTNIVSLWCKIYPPDPKIHHKSTYAALCPPRPHRRYILWTAPYCALYVCSNYIMGLFQEVYREEIRPGSPCCRRQPSILNLRIIFVSPSIELIVQKNRNYLNYLYTILRAICVF